MQDDIRPRAHAFVGEIQPYKLGRSTGELAQELKLPIDKIVRLAANENPHGMSPKAREVVAQNIVDSARYPEVATVQKGIAAARGLDPSYIIPGNGSCEVLELIARAFLNPHRTSVYPLHSFVMYKLATQYMGATGVAVPPGRDYTDNLPAMLAAITPDTTVLWISTINNPTGSFTPYDELKKFFKHIPENVIIVLDEAYAEYLPDDQRVDTSKWVDEFPNLIITHTLSKIYGMAGLRIGYGIASPHIADIINRLRGPYNCNSLGIAAALTALDDQEYVEQSRTRNQAGIRQLQSGLDKLSVKHLAAWGNFVTFETKDALHTQQALLKQGVVVLPLNGYSMPQHIRVSVGTESENARFLEALPKALK